MDVDSGQLIAVKMIKVQPKQDKNDFFKIFKPEIEALGSIQHVSRFPLGGNKMIKKFTRPEGQPGLIQSTAIRCQLLRL